MPFSFKHSVQNNQIRTRPQFSFIRKISIFSDLFISFSVLTVIAILQSSCSHNNSKQNTLRVEQISSPTQTQVQLTQLGLQLTKSGDNFAPRFSEDGHKIIFVSQKRSLHPQAQAYLFDLDSLKEKRLTYQNGQVSEVFLEQNNFVYVSTTDEEKEQVLYFANAKPSENQRPQSEIYVSNLSGTQIQRKTHHPGFDGQLILQKKSEAYFLRQDQQQLSLWQISFSATDKDHSKLLFNIPKDLNSSLKQITPSTNGKNWLWQQDNLIFLSANKSPFSQPTLINLPAGIYQNISWWDDKKIVLSAKSSELSPSVFSKNFQIYIYDLEKKCLSPWIQSENDLTDFSTSTDHAAVAFVAATAQNERQIYYLKTPAIPAFCL